MNEWTYKDLLELVKIKDKNIDHYLERIQELETELDRTRKALDVAKDTIRHADWFFDGDYNVDAKTMHNEIKHAIKTITTLEQKDNARTKGCRMNLDRLKYRYWQHTDWHDTNSPLEAVYCNAVDGCDPTIAVSDFEMCTGLKDKNDNLIYEGDIIFDGYCKRIIKWGGWCWHAETKSAICPLDEFTLRNCEIIGNVHEQAEQKDVK